VEAVLGAIVEVDARAEILWPGVKLMDTGRDSLRETADQVFVLGKTRSGAVFTADIHGGVKPEEAHSTFEVRGASGWLSLTSDHPYGFQAGDLKLTSNVAFPRPEQGAAAESRAYSQGMSEAGDDEGFSASLSAGRLSGDAAAGELRRPTFNRSRATFEASGYSSPRSSCESSLW
jgi:hypothetical protein